MAVPARGAGTLLRYRVRASNASGTATLPADGSTRGRRGLVVARPSVASTTLVWPQPVEPICVKCGIFVDPVNSGYPELWLDGNTTLTARDIVSAALIIEDASTGVLLTKPLDAATVTSRSTVTLTDVSVSIFRSGQAWLSVYTTSGRSLSQQIFLIQ